MADAVGPVGREVVWRDLVPDGKWILFQQDTAGNELWDIFAVPSEGGEVINLTNTPEIREEGPRWSPDGKTGKHLDLRGRPSGDQSGM